MNKETDLAKIASLTLQMDLIMMEYLTQNIV